MKGKKGQPVVLGIMVLMMLIVVIVAITPLLKDTLTEMRDPAHLECSSTCKFSGYSEYNAITKMCYEYGNSTNTTSPAATSIDGFASATCILTDFTLFYFIGTAIAVSVGFMWWRKGQV